MEKNKQPIYPIDPWRIREMAFDLGNNYRNETTFALSNGYIGTRGTFEEGYDFSVEEGLEGNFINGFYESEDIRYGEWNFGFPSKSQSLLNLPNCKTIRLFVKGEELDMRRGTVEDYDRTLHLRDGVVTRSLCWTSPEGHRIKLDTRRFVSLVDKNLMCIRYRVTPLNFRGELKFVSCLNGDVENHTRKTNPLVDYGPFGRRLEPDLTKENASHLGLKELTEAGASCLGSIGLYYQGHTLKSGLSMACGTAHYLEGGSMEAAPVFAGTEFSETVSVEVNADMGECVCLDKFIIYTSSLDMEEEKMKAFVTDRLEKAEAAGYDGAEAAHSQYVHGFWENGDVTIQGDDALQQGIRFNLFHIMQAAGRDGRTGMGAKGLSGEGYEGHYFWDTEMYVLPVFVYTAPDIAKKLLDYRFYTLDQARERAKVLGHPKGALFPWRTINGEEASTYFPLGTAQYHINADIAYAFWLYVTVTGDMEYLKERAAEVLCETARVWADVGCFAECRQNRYCICAVTGPDEYNAIVDNNFYTNLMARENLRNALEALRCLGEQDSGALEALVGKIGLEEEETAYWQRIVDNMYFPYDESRQVYPLDDGFMMRKPWDDSQIAPEKRHLLYENFHPLFVYRQRMSKQADAILGMYLHSNLFTKEELKRNYDFYQEVTLHHSSLSTCIFGIVACEIGYYEEAYRYFSESARMDLDDYHDNFYAGIHAANMAGTWQAVVNGFAGLRTNDGRLCISPYCPPQWKGYSFRLSYGSSRLAVTVNQDRVTVKLEKGKPVTLYIRNKKYTLESEGEEIYEDL